MVSLESNIPSVNRAAQYMDSENRMSEGLQPDTAPILTSRLDESFKKMKTLPATMIHLSFSVTISVIGIILTVSFDDSRSPTTHFAMICMRAVFWLLTFLFDHLLRKHHHDIHLNGYHDFYRDVSRHNGIALNIVSAFNVLLLVILSMIHYHNLSELTQSWIKMNVGLVAVNSAEMVILVVTQTFYMLKIYHFNEAALVPDALRGSHSTSGFIGLMQPNNNSMELLEKQADLITYLKDHNDKLNEKLMQFQMNAAAFNT